MAFVERLSAPQRRFLGLFMAVVSGLFYGVNFDPPTYVMDHNPQLSQNGLDYVFSHFMGIYLTSTFYLILYCVIKKNHPAMYNQSLLPGFICGFMWAIAQISWFYANSQLSMVVSFPIISTGPGVVGALWGIFAFSEIRGFRNYVVLISAFVCTLIAAVLTSLSTLS